MSCFSSIRQSNNPWDPNPKPPSSSSFATTTGLTAQVLAACQKLTPEQLAASAPGAYGTIHRTLGHIIAAEADYVGRLTGNGPQPPFRWEDGPAVADIAAFAESGGRRPARRRPAHPAHPHRPRGGEWQTIDYQARHLFIQVINHGIEHRTNITTILSGLGLPAPEVDGWGYLFAHPDRFELKEGSR